MEKISICDDCILDAAADDIYIYVFKAALRELENRRSFRRTLMYDKCVCCGQRKLVTRFCKEDLELVPVRWRDIEVRPDFSDTSNPTIRFIHRFIDCKGRMLEYRFCVECHGRLTPRSFVAVRRTIMRKYYQMLTY